MLKILYAAYVSLLGLMTIQAVAPPTDPTVKVALIVAIASMVVAFLGAAGSIVVSLINRARVAAKLEEVKQVTVEVGHAVDGRVSDLKAAWDARFESEKTKLIAEIGKAHAEGEIKGGDTARGLAKSDARDAKADARIDAGKIVTPVIEAEKIVTKKSS